MNTQQHTAPDLAASRALVMVNLLAAAIAVAGFFAM
jgi:hypothetical protein